MKRLIIILIGLWIGISAPAQKKNLEYFVNQALTNGPLLKDYDNQRLSLALDSQLIRAALRPQVNGIGSAMAAPIIGGWGYDEAITNKQQVTAMVQVTKSFINTKTLSAELAGLQIQSLTAANSKKITEQDLQKAVADQYILTYGEQLQLDFSNHINGMLKREDDLLKKLTRDNVYKQTDYLAFAVLVQQQLLSAAQLNVQYKYDYATLNYLAGVTDTAIVELEDPHLNAGILGDVTSSVFYTQYMLDSLKLLNDKAMIDINYRPKLSAFADAGYNTTLAFTPYKNIGTSAGLTLSIPIYDGKQKKLQYSKIDIQERTRLVKRDFFIQQRSQQIMQLIQQLHSTDDLLDLINKQVKYTETLITANEKLLATGDIRLVDFIYALNNYFTAKNLLTQNYVTRLKIVSQLKYWEK